MNTIEIQTAVVHPQPRLGDAQLDARVQALLTRMARRCPRQFQVTWTGSKVPRGAQVLGHTIAWTQHGRVITDQNQEVGVYERVVEWGGPTKDQHTILVGLFPEFCNDRQ